MSVETQIDRINSEVSSQTTLISKIKDALQGKSAGSSGSGGGKIETCTCNIFIDPMPGIGTFCKLIFVDSNGKLQQITCYDGDTVTVVKNQICVIENSDIGTSPSVNLIEDVVIRTPEITIICPTDNFNVTFM